LFIDHVLVQYSLFCRALKNIFNGNAEEVKELELKLLPPPKEKIIKQ